MAEATVEFEEVVNNNFFNANGSLVSLLGAPVFYNSAFFQVGPETELSGSIVVNSLSSSGNATVVASLQRAGPNGWVNVVQDTYTGAISTGRELASIDLSTVDAIPGTYRVYTTLQASNLASPNISITTDIDSSVTGVGNVEFASGNLLGNDESGSAYTVLQVLDETSGQYVSAANGPITILGEYGTLTVDSTGNYVYQPQTGSFFTEPRVEEFTYRLVHPAGEVQDSSLTVTVTPTGDGVPAPLIAFESDVVGVDDLTGGIAQPSSSEELSADVEDTGSYGADTDLILAMDTGEAHNIVLDALESLGTADGDAGVPAGTNGEFLTGDTEAAVVETPNPLSHLVTSQEWDDHNSVL